MNKISKVKKEKNDVRSSTSFLNDYKRREEVPLLAISKLVMQKH